MAQRISLFLFFSCKESQPFEIDFIGLCVQFHSTLDHTVLRQLGCSMHKYTFKPILKFEVNVWLPILNPFIKKKETDIFFIGISPAPPTFRVNKSILSFPSRLKQKVGSSMGLIDLSTGGFFELENLTLKIQYPCFSYPYLF